MHQPKVLEVDKLLAQAGRDTDVLLEYLAQFDLDVQIFQALPLYIRSRVLKEGQVLFVRDEDRLYDIAYRTAQAFEDFKPVYYRYLEQVAHVGP